MDTPTRAGSSRSTQTSHVTSLPNPHLAAELPNPLTSIVGRDNERSLAHALLRRPDVRLLTLSGPGGIGKTRLAIELATDMAADFTDGVYFVSLAPVRDASQVVAAIADAIGLQASGGVPLRDTVAATLRDRTVLLVMDNFEHVLDAAPEMSYLLALCQRLKILATSRTLLRLAGEHTIPVPPLFQPNADGHPSFEELAEAPAIRLFTERARAVDPSFELTVTTAPLVAEICRLLDGLPLAIELAARRVRHVSLPALHQRLDRRLHMLTGGSRDQPSRLQTMRNAIAWSYDALAPDERSLFGRLSVFVGGFTLEAAEAICVPTEAQPNPTDSTIFDGLSSLIDASLLQQVAAPDGIPRYQMLETLREYAAEQLAASGEERQRRCAHATYFLSLAERRPPSPFLPDDQAMLRLLNLEQANLREALTWLESSGDGTAFARLVAALSWYWWVHGQLDEGQKWMERALTFGDSVPAAVRARIAMVLGFVTLAGGEPERARHLIEDGLMAAENAGDPLAQAQVLISQGILACARDDYEQATMDLEDALHLARSLPDPIESKSIESAAAANLGIAARGRGDLTEAAALHEEALAAQRQVGYIRGAMLSLTDLGDIARDRGENSRASEYYREGLQMAHAYGELRATAEALEGLAHCALVSGRAGQAVRWFAVVERTRELSGIANWLSFNREVYERSVSEARVALGEKAFSAAWEAGRGLPLAVAVAEAIDTPPASHGATGGLLTSREMEVLKLLAAGHSDRAIAEMLFLSVRTVEAHVGRILTKLDVRSRTAAVDAALALGLIEL